MNRVLAKLEGFIENPDYLLHNPDPYVRSIALFRKGKIDESLELLDPIIAKNPSDGFLFELKGQILFEMDGISSQLAKQASLLAYYKLPIKTKFG